MKPMEESAVLQRPLAVASASAGIDAAQFDEIVLLHQKRILRLLLSILRDREAAETLTQECFLRAFRNRGNFRHEASVSTWLFRIAVNLARDHQRNRQDALVPGDRRGSQVFTEYGVMNFHLDEDGICRSLAETATEAERAHAENCSHCRERITAAAAEFRELKDLLSRAADRDDFF